MKRGFWWLVSYPKSGNTWMRAFLSNYIEQPNEPIDINQLEVKWISSTRKVMDDGLGMSSVYLSHDQIEAYRPALYRRWAADLPIHSVMGQTTILKVHDAFTMTVRGEPIFPPEVSAGVIYLLRNPLDVAVSYAHHRSRSIDDTIRVMADETMTVADQDDRHDRQIRQKYLSWSSHVRSWVGETGIPTLVIRYEDMLHQPIVSFGKVVEFLGLPLDTIRLERALQFSSFDALKRQEIAKGFKEKPAGLSAFFRQGQAGAWKQSLTDEQVAALIHAHQEIMSEYDYALSS